MSNKKDSLGDRMKSFYEAIPKTNLMRRTPVIIRIDGKAFHTFTKGFAKPFDYVLSNTMTRTMKYLCENIQGCVFGYTQSDEITLVLVDYKTLVTNAWFDYEVQKMCSISASMATMAFNRFFIEEVANAIDDSDCGLDKHLLESYKKASERGAMFDSRVFNIPKEEVCNCLIWRQQDATRNSIEMVGRYYFSGKELFKKNGSDIQDMLMTQHNVNWNDTPTRFKRGSACYKVESEIEGTGVSKHSWVIDTEMPILTQDREYVEQFIFVG